jgi:putative ABC transport system substrate-binding protein
VRKAKRNSRKVDVFGWISCAIIAAFCSSAYAQKTYRIGYLTLRPAPFEQDQMFKEELRKLGWFEGQNIAIEFRGAVGKVDRLIALAKELVSMNVDVIVTSSTPSAEAARSATSTIPIVMAGAADPVGTGFVHSLSHPGGNITGLSLQSPELAGKRMELLVQIIPKLAQVAFLAYGRDPAHRLFIKEAEAARPGFKNPSSAARDSRPGRN